MLYYIEPCPVIGSNACRERIFLAACRYLQDNGGQVLTPCQKILKP